MDLVFCMRCERPAMLDDLQELNGKFYHPNCFVAECEDNELCQCCGEPVAQPGAVNHVASKYCGECISSMRGDR